MRVSFSFLLLCALFLFGCSTTRKISKVGIREPNSVNDSHNEEVSALRAKFAALSDLNAKCPKEIKDNLKSIASEKLQLPTCPNDFANTLSYAQNLLTINERTNLELINDSQCQSVVRDNLESYLVDFLNNYETSGPMARLDLKVDDSAKEEDGAILVKLQQSLAQVNRVNVPLEKWILASGDYYLTENDLYMLDDLLVKHSCDLGDANLDDVERTLHSMEDLLHLVPNASKNKESFHALLQGLNKLMDKKIKGLF